MAYASASTVAKYTLNLLDGATIFDDDTDPDIEAIDNWLSAGCAIIESSLAGCYYTVPVTAGTTAYDWVVDLNALYAAARAEMSRTNLTLSPGERTRGQVFEEMFWEQLDKLCSGDMTLAGLSRSGTGKMHVGGISVSRKQTVERDTDRVAPRFGRDLFKFDKTINPATSTASK